MKYNPEWAEMYEERREQEEMMDRQEDRAERIVNIMRSLNEEELQTLLGVARAIFRGSDTYKLYKEHNLLNFKF